MTTVSTRKIDEETSALEVARRYPRLVAHLICDSLGYFTPQAAASAQGRDVVDATYDGAGGDGQAKSKKPEAEQPKMI